MPHIASVGMVNSVTNSVKVGTDLVLQRWFFVTLYDILR